MNKTILGLAAGVLLGAGLIGAGLALKGAKNHHGESIQVSTNSTPITYKESNVEYKGTTTLTGSLSGATGLGVKKVKNLVVPTSRVVVLAGAIGPEAFGIAQKINQLSQESEDPIYLIISSPGGSVLDGVQVISAMQASKAPVYTIDVQIAASMAAITFEFGKKRYMVDRSLLMFHEASGGFQGPFNQMKSRFEIFNRLVQKLDIEVATRVGQTPEEFASKLGNEIWLDSEDAVNTKYADGLVNLQLKYDSPTGESAEAKLSQTKLINNVLKINMGENGNVVTTTTPVN